MEIIDPIQFTADHAWGSRALMTTGDYRAKLHWTDQPYRWHQNSGEELFVVLDGVVDMHYAPDEHSEPLVAELRAGMVALIRAGDHHVAHPRGAARILVLERQDSE